MSASSDNTPSSVEFFDCVYQAPYHVNGIGPLTVKAIFDSVSRSNVNVMGYSTSGSVATSYK